MGIAGAIVMRGIFIVLGSRCFTASAGCVVFAVPAVHRGEIAISQGRGGRSEDNLALRLARRYLRTTTTSDGDRFFVVRTACLRDAVFPSADRGRVHRSLVAVDSVPAVLAISDDIYTSTRSNVMAIRAAGALFRARGMMSRFHYLGTGCGHSHLHRSQDGSFALLSSSSVVSLASSACIGEFVTFLSAQEAERLMDVSRAFERSPAPPHLAAGSVRRGRPRARSAPLPSSWRGPGKLLADVASRPPGGGAPYDSPSAFAGSPWLVSLEGLVRDGYLEPSDLAASSRLARAPRALYNATKRFRERRLRKAFAVFSSRPGAEHELRTYANAQQDWLPDYALFCALKRAHGGRPWVTWPREFVHRDAHALERARRDLGPEVEFHTFVQLQFARQWAALRAHCDHLGVQLLGDVPMFVAHDAADVWQNQRYFLLNENGHSRVVAGVPPDYFSADGRSG